jgi:hypothetical protein
VAVALGAAALFVLVFDATFVNDRPAPESEHLPSVRQGESKGASDETLQRQPTVRRIEAVVHPAREEPAAPPFGVQSVRGGKDGFVVMDDGRVLVPGNAWRELTLERIEPRRILFSGRYPAELPW